MMRKRPRDNHWTVILVVIWLALFTIEVVKPTQEPTYSGTTDHGHPR